MQSGASSTSDIFNDFDANLFNQNHDRYPSPSLRFNPNDTTRAINDKSKLSLIMNEPHPTLIWKYSQP
jgi:hypothetical protein